MAKEVDGKCVCVDQPFIMPNSEDYSTCKEEKCNENFEREGNGHCVCKPGYGLHLSEYNCDKCFANEHS